MTVKLHIGRRVPKNWFKRTATKVKGLLSFQENMWQMVMQAMALAKRRAKADGRLIWNTHKEFESEDLHWQLEWFVISIQGTKDMEEEEYNETMVLYDSMGKHFKKDFPQDANLAKFFKSSMLSQEKLKEAYDKGYGAVENKSYANKLLEMGILTHIEWIPDYDSRKIMLKQN
jgi:hypothetical protein